MSYQANATNNHTIYIDSGLSFDVSLEESFGRGGLTTAAGGGVGAGKEGEVNAYHTRIMVSESCGCCTLPFYYSMAFAIRHYEAAGRMIFNVSICITSNHLIKGWQPKQEGNHIVLLLRW